MADIFPFKGLRYNQELVPDLAKVVIPPYDVISEAEQKRFRDLHPYNMVHLELGKSVSDDHSRNDLFHNRAASLFKEWQKKRVLIREKVPSIYYYELDFTIEGQRRTRYGFICLLRLEPFETKKVRPHEKTFTSVKDERLSLMLHCHANLSPVYGLYDDSRNRVIDLLRAACPGAPIIEYSDENRMAHRVWNVTDRRILEELRRLMADRVILIADGHHRYETALSYRSHMRRLYPGAGPFAPFEFVMMYLASIQQEGVCILPTHRLVRPQFSFGVERFLSDATSYFRVTRYEPTDRGRDAWKEALRRIGDCKRNAVGFYSGECQGYYLLEPLVDRIEQVLAERRVAPILRELDVVIVEEILFRKILGLSEEFLNDPKKIRFHHSLSDALREIRDGSGEWGFFINPTRIDQVWQVSEAGYTMPHKATYFYPKVVSGLVINPLIVTERIGV